MIRGKFITLEGLDGGGKSTHLAWLSGFLQNRGIPVRVTREPGGTPLGETLRGLLLDVNQCFNCETEALLMFAARREHLDKVILPSLNAGIWVMCDRFTDASFAYQSSGSGVDWDKIEQLESWVHGTLQPDLTLYFDVTPELGRSRTTALKEPDRYEQEQNAFYERVRCGYLRRVREHGNRIRAIDANHSMPDVERELQDVMSLFCSGIASLD